ncbi:VanZ family protein [Arthrobacter psychrochitiniphilus]|uniref:VanZ family protein n=1 Tax=Arthrobacter psychrochitiniphilus TaxID=291045 RepID=A0A2V3DXQ4_9MICC|nr:VanZ family protein [Arthrobacter psychrochitiniphilus]NYG16579.1 glycopeptide antibiotics resistance protein [Arthrobacter psychrochitiniphilus]PXA69300.1 VanZ family protein [Arthrobacter psychrochitiniphilus]
MNTWRRKVAIILVVGYFVALAAIVFWPTPVDRPVGGELLNFLRWLRSLSIPQWIASYTTIEFTANVIMFIPFGIIVAVRLRPYLWWLALPAGALLSAIIELSQNYFLPERFGDPRDVVANASGALLGALCVALFRISRPAQPLVPPASELPT